MLIKLSYVHRISHFVTIYADVNQVVTWRIRRFGKLKK